MISNDHLPSMKPRAALSVKLRLFISLGLLASTLAAVIVVGWIALSISNAGLQTVFDDRVVPLRDLKIVSDMYAVNIVDTAHKVRNGNENWAFGVKSVSDARTTIGARWKAYIATYLVGEEKKLVDEVRPLMAAADVTVDELLKVLKDEDVRALDTFVKQRLYQTIDPVTDRIGALVDLQIVVAGEEYGRSATSFTRSRWAMMASAAVATLIVMLTVWTILRRVTGPVAAMTVAMTRLAGGDNDVVVPETVRRDEIGAMAQAVQVFKDNAIAMAKMKSEQEAMELRAAQDKRDAMNRLAGTFESSVRGVVETVSSAATEMRASAESMASAAEETSRQATTVGAASEQASTNVQTVASASEELSASIGEITRQVTQSSRIASQAVNEVGQANLSVQGLSEAAQRIGDVVKLINDIAGQTNLLALNATIEAARAGEAGKGFAVVASEVKSLATQTAKATEDIAAQIAAIQGATQHSVSAISSIGKTICEINEIATSIASGMEEQGAATQEIARNVQEAAKGTGEVSANIVGVTQAAAETGSAASQMRSAAGELSTQAETLRGEVDKFLAAIRAA